MSHFFFAQVNWQQVEPGVWKEIVGIPAADPNKYVLVIKLELNEKLPVSKLISNTANYFEIADEQK